MVQKIPGRNDPCPCGSGIKYKKCCLVKDEEARQSARAERTAAITESESAEEDETQSREANPHIEAFNARLGDFEAADYEGKFDIFNRTLDEPELMDGDMAFEMLNDLFHYTINYGERNRFDARVESLRKRLPETYDAEAHHFLKWRITNALVESRPEDAGAFFLELAPLAGKDIDIFNRVEEMVAYHGQLPALVASMSRAWPSVKSSNDIVPWGIDEFCTRAMSYELLNFADQMPEPTAATAALLERLNFYSEIDPKLIAAYLDHLCCRNERQWTANDFVLSPPHSRREEDEEEEEINEETIQPSGERNLYLLTIEFLGHLRCVEGVPYAKGELGRRELHQFILGRHYGRLEYRESMLEAAERDIKRKQSRRLKPKRKYRKYEHTLVPDPERLEHFLADLLDMMNQLYYRASAFFEIIPPWLRFLEMHRLIEAESRIRTLDRLAHLADDLNRIFEKYAVDPNPGQAIHGWRDRSE